MVFLESASGDQLIRDDPENIALYGSYVAQLSHLSLAPKQANNLLRELINRLHHANESATVRVGENQ
jgi:hypothetical protein